MKSICYYLSLFLFLLPMMTLPASAQPEGVFHYHFNGTPSHGIKIRTTIPFVHGGSMPTVRIEGYFYQRAAPVGIDVVWYTYNNTFVHAVASCWGATAPPIYLANEAGYVTLFMDVRPYYSRLMVTVFSEGRKTDLPSAFTGWQIVDEPLAGTSQLLVPYMNQFAGKVKISGNLLIGKTAQTNPNYRLDVKGDVRADRLVVNSTGADYVFDSSYNLLHLDILAAYIEKHKHLPDIPSAAKIQQDGLDVGDNQRRLLEKVEELTLYVIALKRRLTALEQQYKTNRSK